MSSHQLSNFPYPSRYQPLVLSNPLTSLGDLRSGHVPDDEWDPCKAYDEAQLEARLADVSSESPSTDDVKLGLNPQSHRTLYLGLSLTATPPTSVSSPENRLVIHRGLTATSSPLAYPNTQTLDSVSCPLLPPIRVQPTLTTSLAGSPSFALSQSDFANALDHDFHSCSSDQEDLETNDPFLQENLGYPTKSTIKRSFSNPELYRMSHREKFIYNLTDVNSTKPDNPLVCVTSAPPPVISTVLFSPSQPSERNHRSSPLESPIDIAVHFPHDLPSTTVHSFSKPGIRPLPKPPANVPVRSKPSTWVPPSSWGLPEDDGSEEPQDSPPLPRPSSTFCTSPKAPIRPDQTALRPSCHLSRPQSAPDGDSRPPADFDQSPLIALDKRRPQPQTFLKFHRTALPTQSDLELASKLEVIGESGVRVPFGTLFHDQKTVVIFIRHFWCPLCQDYMYSLNSSVSPSMLNQSGVKLVVVGNGSPSMIKAYRKIFQSPFKMYTDPSLHVYNALGMSLRTSDAGPHSECGGYVRHGLISGTAMVVKNALAHGLPVWEKGGNIQQLGGEFVLGPGLSCSFAHRMHTTRSHAPVLSILDAAGVPVRVKVYMHRQITKSVSTVGDDDESWVAKTKRLTSLRNKKEERRYGSQWTIE